jgi:8-oxo-dGTP diphosphatase
VVDVANVMGARADGWWRDRAGAALRLCREVLALAARETGPPGSPGARPAAAWVLVLEGRARDAAERLRDPAPPAADAAEDWVPPPAAASEAPSAEASAAGTAAPVRVVSAPASGDDAIVGVVAEVIASGENCLVVTADRELRRRCEALGAAVAGPGWLLRLLLPGSIGNLPSPMHRTMW